MRLSTFINFSFDFSISISLIRVGGGYLLFYFSIMLRLSYILKKKLFICSFLVYLDVHMVKYLFHQKEYNVYHQNKM